MSKHGVRFLGVRSDRLFILATLLLLVAFSGSILGADAQFSAEQELKKLLSARAHESTDPRVLLRLSDLYLDIGDNLNTDMDKRRAAYEEGARLAQHALHLHEANADAHYLYAANLGSAAQLKGMMASALTIRDLKAHVTRALELQNDHAPALHMMGMMLEELPWVLGGDARAALVYLKQAVKADPQNDHARLDLAKAYIKRRDPDAARRELHTILDMDQAGDGTGADRYHSEAQHLLESLEPKK